jgi:hypothetical protein
VTTRFRIPWTLEASARHIAPAKSKCLKAIMVNGSYIRFPVVNFPFVVLLFPFPVTIAKMPSSLRYAALAALFSSVYSYVLEMPSPTIGMGLPLMDIMPTEAPSFELVKKTIAKRALTSTCSDWTILGLDGQYLCAFRIVFNCLKGASC